MPVELDGSQLRIEDVEAVARNRDQVSVSKDAWGRIDVCRSMIQRKIDAHEVMYGVTTGTVSYTHLRAHET